MDQPRTFPAVAARFGVSDTAVRKHANAERWRELALEADTRAAEKALAAAGRTREQRAAQLLRIYDHAADRIEAGVKADANGSAPLELELVFAKFPEIHRIYRLETDQATDQVAVAEVQAGFRSAMQVAIATVEAVAGELLGERKAAELVRAYRARFLPAVNEALAIGGGDQ